MKTQNTTSDRIVHSLVRSLFAFAAVAGVVAAFSSTAQATVIQTTHRIINAGPADFGSGSHSLGSPVSNATVTYDWSTNTGSLLITGRVRGTLYWDSLFSSGCARLTIRFRNAANADIGLRRIDECGPGGDANNSQNKTSVDESFVRADLDHIVLTVAELRGGAEVNPQTVPIPQLTQRAFSVLINNGRADFGSSDPTGHHFGRPDKGGRIIFNRGNGGPVLSLVDGVLYYDSPTASSCAQMVIDWLSAQNAILDQFTALNCGPGGDANLAANKFFIFRNPAFASLAKIRIIVEDTAAPQNAVLQTYNFAGLVGDFEVEPAEAGAAVNEPINYSFAWTVPEPMNWHDLSLLELRITDGADPILHVRFDEANNLISVLNEATGRFGKGFPAGSNNRLQTRYATLDLAETTVGPVNSVLGSGPESPTVRLNLALSFKPSAAGKTYQVEVAARDDLGNEDPFTLAGTLTVTR